MSTAAFRFKQVIAVRRDLKMGKGKVAAQVSHACVTAAEETRRQHADWWKAWFDEGQCKVVVKVADEEELRSLEKHARSQRLPIALVQDRGLTQIPEGTVTCLGIGPAPSELIDKITRHLSLL